MANDNARASLAMTALRVALGDARYALVPSSTVPAALLTRVSS